MVQQVRQMQHPRLQEKLCQWSSPSANKNQGKQEKNKGRAHPPGWDNKRGRAARATIVKLEPSTKNARAPHLERVVGVSGVSLGTRGVLFASTGFSEK